MSLLSLCPQGSVIVVQGKGREIARARGSGWHQGNSIFQIIIEQRHRWTHTTVIAHKTHTSSNPIIENGKWVQHLTTSKEVFRNWYLLGETKAEWQWVHQLHHGSMTRSSWATQNRLHVLSWLFFFVLFCYFMSLFRLDIFLEKRKNISWMGMEGRIWGDLGKEKCD